MAGMLNGAKAYQAQQRLDMNRLVESYAPLVKRIALHLKARLPACVEVDDLIQSGMIGLMDAASHYEDGHGAVFETYASIRIRGAMIDELRQSDWAPRSVHQNTRSISDAISRLSNKLGREPRDFEIANELGVDIDKYHQMLNDSSSSQMIGIEDLGVSADVIAEGGDNTKDKLFDTLATSIDGNQIRALDNGILTTYNKDLEIYKQWEFYTLKDNYNKNVRYEVKRERTDNIDNTDDANDIFAQ